MYLLVDCDDGRWLPHILISFVLILIIAITLILIILILLLITLLIIVGASGVQGGRVSYGSAVWDSKGSRLTGLSHTGGRGRVPNAEQCTEQCTGGRKPPNNEQFTVH